MERKTAPYEVRDRSTNVILWQFSSNQPTSKLVRVFLDWLKINRQHIANNILTSEGKEIEPTDEEIDYYLALTTTPKYVKKLLKYI